MLARCFPSSISRRTSPSLTLEYMVKEDVRTSVMVSLGGRVS